MQNSSTMLVPFSPLHAAFNMAPIAEAPSPMSSKCRLIPLCIDIQMLQLLLFAQMGVATARQGELRPCRVNKAAAPGTRIPLDPCIPAWIDAPLLLAAA